MHVSDDWQRLLAVVEAALVFDMGKSLSHPSTVPTIMVEAPFQTPKPNYSLTPNTGERPDVDGLPDEELGVLHEMTPSMTLGSS
jgi:hypothetical protein